MNFQGQVHEPYDELYEYFDSWKVHEKCLNKIFLKKSLFFILFKKESN
jgi:hypothetical protein